MPEIKIKTADDKTLTIIAKDGVDGLNGKDGYTPIKGKDYNDGVDGKTPTSEELIAIIEPLIPSPIAGKDGENGKDGKKGDKGDKGEKGDKGDKGEKGKDVDESVVNEIEEKVNFALQKSSRDYDFKELKDVSISNPTNGQVPVYNSTTGKWENDDIASGGVQSVVAGTNVTVDNTDPANPIVSSLSDRYKTTSTTSNTIVSTGSLTFTVDSGLSYIPEQDVIIVYDASNHMHGTITSYSGTTMVVDIQHKTGSGTYASWTINLDGTPVDAITGSLTTSRIPYATGISTLGDSEHHIWDDTTKSVGVQVDTPKATVHSSATIGQTLNDVTTGSISLITETLPAIPSGSIIQIAEPLAGSGGSASYVDGGSGSAISANGSTYDFRVYPCLVVGSTYYRSQFYEGITAGTDPNDAQGYNILLSWGSVTISGETINYYVEYDVNTSGSWQPLGIFSGTNQTITSLSGSDSTTSFPTYYSNADTPPTAFTGGSAQATNVGMGGISETGNTILMEVDSVKTISGTDYCSGSPTSGSFSDSGLGTYDAEISWTDNGNATNAIVRISVDNGSTWYYYYVGSTTSPYTITSLTNDTTAESRWGQTFSASVTYTFKPYGTGTSPSGNTIYSTVGSSYSTTTTDAQNYIFKHTLTGNTNGKVLDNSSTYGYVYSGGQFYDVGFGTWSSGTTVTPSSYGYSGTNQNRDYKVYSYSPSLGIYSPIPFTVTTTSSGGSKYVSGTFSYPSGVTQVKILRSVNGGAYGNSKFITSGTTFIDDATDNTWSGNDVVTPTTILGIAGRFDKASTSGTLTPAVSIVHTGGGVGLPQIGFGVAPDENSEVTNYVARIGVSSTSTGFLQAVTSRFDIGNILGGSVSTMIGVSNIFNNLNSSSIHFQVKSQNDSSLINTRSDQDTVGFGQAIGSDQQTTVQIHPARAGDIGLVMKGHASHTDSNTLIRFQTNANSYTGEITVGGWWRGSTGAVANPSLSCRSDTNTGMYFPSSDILGLVTGGVERVRIDNGGNVGIGTTNITARLDINQVSLGQAVLRVRSEATNDDPTIFKYQNRVATTDATVTTLHSVSTVSDNSYIVEAKVLARRTGGSAGTASDTAGYKIIGVFKNNAGTLTQVGTTTVIHTSEDQAGWNCTFDTSGTTIRVRVTGATNNNVTWHLVELDVSNLSS